MSRKMTTREGQRVVAARRPVELHCEQCGAAIVTYRPGRYCGAVCRVTAWRQRRKVLTQAWSHYLGLPPTAPWPWPECATVAEARELYREA